MRFDNLTQQAVDIMSTMLDFNFVQIVNLEFEVVRKEGIIAIALKSQQCPLLT
ncbi:MAG TPA: hypothetical protein VNW52_06345 [Burkholderiaceae bacterium]|jgi:hypothetical protein|nr:hypothetical protein [Burkholderiaceae bacterium]